MVTKLRIACLAVCFGIAGCQEPVNVQLYHASKAGDIGKVDDLLEHGADPSASCDPFAFDGKEFRESPFIVACYNGQLEVLKRFLAHGISTELRDQSKSSPVAIVILSSVSMQKSTRLEMVRLLADHGFDLDCVGEPSVPIHCAIACARYDIAQFLIERKCHVEARSLGKSILSLLFENRPTQEGVAIGMAVIEILSPCSETLRDGCQPKETDDGWAKVRTAVCEKVKQCEKS
jgi:hypothetical protein